MEFPVPLQPAQLVRRYQRFLADVVLPGGEPLTVHVPNTGSLLGCVAPGLPVWLSDSGNPERRCRFTWEQVAVGEARVGINTHRANALVGEALEAGLLPDLIHYSTKRAEVRYGIEKSRIDWLLSGPGLPDCYLEVKNVTAAVEQGIALFPDAVSTRGTKHLRELMGMVREGARAVLVFCVQRDDVAEVRPADAIDPDYGRTLREALEGGVEAYALRATLDERGVRLTHLIPIFCPPE
ncbi:MAG: DNA/RNA nuclease SfsA [Betaproteobacteria bacterium]|nr:DNA/RNA nuclease SfsA [Betaproteobacteria bacterium]